MGVSGKEVNIFRAAWAWPLQEQAGCASEFTFFPLQMISQRNMLMNFKMRGSRQSSPLKDVYVYEDMHSIGLVERALSWKTLQLTELGCTITLVLCIMFPRKPGEYLAHKTDCKTWASTGAAEEQRTDAGAVLWLTLCPLPGP